MECAYAARYRNCESETADKRQEERVYEIEIIKDNEKYNTVTLTAENNWSYHWTANDNKAVWQVIEKDTNKNYTVTYESFKNTFVITNTYVGEHKDPPVTWPYTIAMCVSGTLLIILCIATRKKEGKG